MPAVALEDPDQPDVRALIDALDRYQAALYPPQSNHFVEVAALRRPDVLFAVARDDAGHAGGCAAVVLGPQYGELKRTMVRPELRGRGWGAKLLAFVEAEAARAGCTLLRLETGIAQPQALGLYARAGYSRCAPFGGYAHDPLSVFMEKQLDGAVRGPRIVVFAKAPRAGQVKTRLEPALGAAGAARLARALLEHTLRQARAAGCGMVELCASPAWGDDAAWRDADLPRGLLLSAQGEGDLGARLARAARRALADAPAVLLIGTDCPALDAARLRDAAVALAAHGAFMQPSADGGYVLLGVTRFDARLFEGIAWSTPSVAAATRTRFAALGWPLHAGEMLHDIDEPADLAHLPPSLAAAR